MPMGLTVDPGIYPESTEGGRRVSTPSAFTPPSFDLRPWHQLSYTKSAAISAMAMTVRFGLARTASGMMEASMTRSPRVP